MMKRTLTRRNFLKVSGGALVGAYALGLAGCGGGSQGGSSKSLELDRTSTQIVPTLTLVAVK